MYKTVVFDLDGTLLNTLTDLADAGNRLCRKYGWPTHERQAYRYFVGNGIPKLVERLAPADQRTPAVLEAALADFKRDYGQHLRGHHRTVPRHPRNAGKAENERRAAGGVFQQGGCAGKRGRQGLFRHADFTIVRGQMTGVAPKARRRGHERPAAGPAC